MRRQLLIFGVLMCARALVSMAEEPAAKGSLVLTEPVDYEVRQQDGAAMGRIWVAGKLARPVGAEEVIETRLDQGGKEGEWTPLTKMEAGQGSFRAELKCAAGGWFGLRVRARHGEEVAAEGVVEHVGVGEVFVVAGQSNSANHGEVKQTPRSSVVAAFDGAKWQMANDPQPGASGNGGSFLPAFGDAIAERFHVPVGLVALGVGATSVREWLPSGVRFENPPTLTGRVVQLPDGDWEAKGQLFERLSARLKQLGPHGCRAVLWHQGESDANQQDPTRTLPGAQYEKLLGRVIADSRREAGWNVPWFVARASYHTAEDPGSPEIRAAQKAVVDSGRALAGPDSDALGSEWREHGGKGVHFNGAGLRRHGELWAEKVGEWIAGLILRPGGSGSGE